MNTFDCSMCGRPIRPGALDRDGSPHVCPANRIDRASRLDAPATDRATCDAVRWSRASGWQICKQPRFHADSMGPTPHVWEDAPAVSAPEGGRPIEFNINDSVWVKLTAHGRAHLNGKWPSYQTKIERPDGWSKWQLWHLMEAFGDALYLGCQMPFETVIRIPQPEPASPSRAALLGLVTSWRERSIWGDVVYERCADELAALLTSEPSDQAP